MKNSLLFCLTVLTFLTAGDNGLYAQKDKTKRASPPAVAAATSGDLTITVDYSSPGVKDREVLGNLIPNGKIWRLGANEATTFEVNKDVLIEGKKLAAGKYALFSTQDGGDWTLIFNTVPDQWGAYDYDQSKDALRVDVSPGKSDDFVERMAFAVNETKSGAADVVFNWEYIEVKFSVESAN